MNKKQLIELLVQDYAQDENELKEMDKEELEELLEEFEDHSDMFPNGDENDGSHEWD